MEVVIEYRKFESNPSFFTESDCAGDREMRRFTSARCLVWSHAHDVHQVAATFAESTAEAQNGTLGFGPFLVWRKDRTVQKQFVQVYLLTRRADQEDFVVKLNNTCHCGIERIS